MLLHLLLDEPRIVDEFRNDEIRFLGQDFFLIVVFAARRFLQIVLGVVSTPGFRDQFDLRGRVLRAKTIHEHRLESVVARHAVAPRKNLKRRAGFEFFERLWQHSFRNRWPGYGRLGVGGF